jgi:hypothetical protein
MIYVPQLYQAPVKPQPRVVLAEDSAYLRDIGGLWLFNEFTSTTFTETARRQVPATLTGAGYSWNRDQVQGEHLTLTGSAGTYINANANLRTTNAPMTCMAVTKWTSNPVFQCMIGRWTPEDFFFFSNNTGRVGLGGRVLGTYKEGLTTNGWNDGQWHVIFGICNGTTIDMYVDGMKDYTSTATTGNFDNNAGAQTTIIGDRNLLNAPYSGSFSIVAFWNRALSRQEVFEITDNPYVMLPPEYIDTDIWYGPSGAAFKPAWAYKTTRIVTGVQ